MHHTDQWKDLEVTAEKSLKPSTWHRAKMKITPGKQQRQRERMQPSSPVCAAKQHWDFALIETIPSGPGQHNTETHGTLIPCVPQLLSLHHMTSPWLGLQRHGGNGSPRCSFITGKELRKFTPRLSDAGQWEWRNPNPQFICSSVCSLLLALTRKKSQSSESTESPQAWQVCLSEHRTAPWIQQPLGGLRTYISISIGPFWYICNDLSEIKWNSEGWGRSSKGNRAIHFLPHVPNEQSHLVIFLLLPLAECFIPLPSQLSCKNIDQKKF